MKHRIVKGGLLMALLMAMAGSTVLADGVPEADLCPVSGSFGAAPATAEPTATELYWSDFRDRFRHPTPWLEMGLDFRFRTIYSENPLTLQQDTPGHRNNLRFQRYRTRWWTKWILGDDVDVNTRLVWEFRTWQMPTANDTDWGEAFFDHFNIRLRNLAGHPLTATLGRQDIILGAGWLVLDGDWVGGSRSISFDAARFTYDWADQATKIDLIYINQDARLDRPLPAIDGRDRLINPDDEEGVILYLTNTSLAPVQLEGFFIYKKDTPPNRQFQLPGVWHRRAEIYTFGAAVSGTQGENWRYRAEGAAQTGGRHTRTTDMADGERRDLRAFGALTNLTYLFKDELNNSVHVGYEYASGNNPDTDRDEQFDLLWGKWPRWSEMYIYSYQFETKVADTTNLHRANVGHKFNPHAQLQVSTDYHALWADQPGQPWLTGLNGINIDQTGDNKFRGHLFTLWLNYRFTDQLRGHILQEYLIPGRYYTERDNSYWFRFNIEYTF